MTTGHRLSVLATALLLIGIGLHVAPMQAQTTAAAPAPQSAMQIQQAADAAAPPPTATFAYGTGPQQRGQLRVPEGDGPFPVAIVIHGGCWVAEMGGTGLPGLSEMLRQRGIATWDIDYRRVGHAGGGWPGSFEDVAAGIDHLGTVANGHPLDLDRVVTIGHSAGALFALWAPVRAQLAAPWTPSANSPHIKAAVAIDGPGALAPMIGIDAQVCGQPVIVPLMGGTPAQVPDAYRAASPSDHLPLGVRQLFVTAELGPFMQGYIDAAKAAGDPVEVFAPPSPNHFDVVTPGLANGEAVADWIAKYAFATREVSSPERGAH